jgi:Immunity protein 53
MNRITEIQDWYSAHCNGVWEHRYGIKIDSLDNPGWWVKVELIDTELEQASFTPINVHISDSDWVNCKIEEKIFTGAGDPTKLEIILGVFLDWAKRYTSHPHETA